MGAGSVALWVLRLFSVCRRCLALLSDCYTPRPPEAANGTAKAEYGRVWCLGLVRLDGPAVSDQNSGSIY